MNQFIKDKEGNYKKIRGERGRGVGHIALFI